ncbi:MAG TPA: Uma2 family endonuclease [Tepidisphaeraceae bacterium]|nr:Uma2 family endonuclease [Tepidisphaeraceae bacterium]
MTVIDQPLSVASQTDEGEQHFIFEDADWSFYLKVSENLGDRRVFATYYKGRLEVVTVPYLHGLVVSLLSQLVWILAEETDTPITPSGMLTLRRKDLKAGVEPDSSFYIAHRSAVKTKKEIDLSVDPAPDLAIEVEITRRLAARQAIYREIGVPEVWLYKEGEVIVLRRRGSQYKQVEQSPTFPQISPREMAEFVARGLEDDTAWTKFVRRRVREIIAAHPRKG